MPYKNQKNKKKNQRKYYKEHPEKFNIKCIHGRAKTHCRECGGGGICEHSKKRDSCRLCCPQSFCVHDRRKNTCKECGGSQICKHNKTRSICALCGGGSVCKHRIQSRSCRECFPLAWAKRLISHSAANARKKGYAPVNATPEQILNLIEKSPTCCGCGGLLDYRQRGFYAPCLHHDHITGGVVGFAHRECNALEGQLQKLGNRLIVFLKNFFPQVGA